jgi:hypothetical protein
LCATVVLGVVVAVASVRTQIGVASPGFVVWQNLIVPAIGAIGPSPEAAAVPQRTVVTGIDDAPVRDATQLRARVRSEPPGTWMTYAFRWSGRMRGSHGGGVHRGRWDREQRDLVHSRSVQRGAAAGSGRRVLRAERLRAECEDRTPAACAAEGGTPAAAATCGPDSCVAASSPAAPAPYYGAGGDDGGHRGGGGSGSGGPGRG